MKYEYEIIETSGFAPMLKRTDDKGNTWWIPVDEANSDYQRYLNPEAEHLNGSGL